MKSTELIKQLRETTQAGMADCIAAIKESNGDFNKAIDLIKIKGKNIVSGREGRVAAEGAVMISQNGSCKSAAMVEVNCQTDFVGNSSSFRNFTSNVVDTIFNTYSKNQAFDIKCVEDDRQTIVSTTKENVVIRRWWFQEAIDPKSRVFTYVHSNNKIGVIITLLASTEQALVDSSFVDLGNDLAMQVAAMNPIAISIDSISQEDKDRQQAIFESQLREANKPQASWEKILAGKFNRWYSDVCLLEQESVVVPKTAVKSVIANIEKKLSCTIEVSNMIRCQVGEFIVKDKIDLADEVAKLI